MPLPITAFYAGLLGLWVMFLAAKVGQRRARYRVGLGSGDVPELESAIRGHGNATETIPLALVMLGLAEGLGTPGWVLLVLGATLSIGRFLHGYHFLAMPAHMRCRVWGMMLTVVPIILLGIGLLGHGLLRLLGASA